MLQVRDKVLKEIAEVKSDPEYLGESGHQTLNQMMEQQKKLNLVV